VSGHHGHLHPGYSAPAFNVSQQAEQTVGDLGVLGEQGGHMMSGLA